MGDCKCDVSCDGAWIPYTIGDDWCKDASKNPYAAYKRSCCKYIREPNEPPCTLIHAGSSEFVLSC